jgi:hypothetical protein
VQIPLQRLLGWPLEYALENDFGRVHGDDYGSGHDVGDGCAVVVVVVVVDDDDDDDHANGNEHGHDYDFFHLEVELDDVYE